VLAVSLLSGLTVPAGAAAVSDENRATALGSISATLRLDYPQTRKALEDRNVTVTAELQQGEAKPHTAKITSFRNRDGSEVSEGEQVGYVDFACTGLEPGKYTVKFTGKGYVSYEHEVTLEDYSQHLVLGTGDVFLLGDVNGDSVVDENDREEVSVALGAKEAKTVNSFDLNGDGEVDITDLAYVVRQMDADRGEVKLYDTACFNAQIYEHSFADGTRRRDIEGNGEVNNLLLDNSPPVTLERSDGQEVSTTNRISLTLTLTQEVETQELRIVSPPIPGAPQTGVVKVESVDGTKMQFPFDIDAPVGIHAIGRTEGSSVIVIPLGNRVPVKKITIEVTKSQGNQFVTLEHIEFLKDIVPENPVAPNSVVRGLTADAGDKQVALKWNALPNVSGYQVDWWPTGDSSKQRSLQVQTTSAEVTGLENLVEYTFIVTPTNSGWSGKPSAAVTATPTPAGAPKAPDMVTVIAGDASLAVSWKTAEDATYYEVYYTDQQYAPTTDYQLAASGLTETHTTIAGLTNGVTYYIYIVAGNEIGRGGAHPPPRGRRHQGH